MRGRSAARRVAADVAGAKAKVVEAREAAVAELARAEQLDSERGAVVDDSAAFHALAEQADRARLEAERLELIAARREADVERIRSQGAVAVYEEARQDAQRGYAAAAKLSAAAARAIETARDATDALTEARSRADEAAHAAEELRPADVDRPVYADEPDWPAEAARVAEIVSAGPRQPAKSQADAIAKQAAERAQASVMHIRAIVEERGKQLGGKRETDAEVLRIRFSMLASRREEVLDLIEAERERQRAAYEERQARKGDRQPYVIEA